MKQGSEEWFAARLGRVTGSIAGAILGYSPHQTRDQVMRAKVREYHDMPSEIDDFTVNTIFTYGKQMEPVALEQFCDDHTQVDECGFYPYEDWLGASPDGLIGDDAILEIKCPWSLRKGGEFKSIKDQPHYHAQMQIEMHCTGRNRAFFYQWNPYDAQLEIVDYDPYWIARHLPLLKDFYSEYLRERENPDKYELLNIDTIHVDKLLREYDELQMQIDVANERKKVIIAEFAEITKGQNAILGGGRKFTHVQPTKGNIQYAKAVKENLPDLDLEPYRGKPAKAHWKLT